MSVPTLQYFDWNGLEGQFADDWQFTNGIAQDFPWARWTSPELGPEAWPMRFVLHCVLHPNREQLPFDTWLQRDLVDSEKAFRAPRREMFAGREALRSAPVAGFDHLDSLLFVDGNKCVYQFRITGLAAELHWGEPRPLSDLLASLRIKGPDEP